MEGHRQSNPAAARHIRLRRPATLSVMDEPHVPEGPPAVMDEVQWRWDALCKANPRYYDGRLYHVLGVSRNGYGGAVVHVADCAYRFYAVQDRDFDLGVRPLGVKGLVRRDGEVLLGKRSMTVSAYQHQWEFAPAGVVEPGQAPAETIAIELGEETGLEPIGEPTPIALMFDDVLRCWELVFRLAAGREGRGPRSDEYDELCWCSPSTLPAPLTPIAQQMVPIVREWLDTV